MKYRRTCSQYSEVSLGNPGGVPHCRIYGIEPNCEICKRPDRTNADYIRKMTDLQLARFLADGCSPERECPTARDGPYPKDDDIENCTKCWLKWLEQEEGGNNG